MALQYHHQQKITKTRALTNINICQTYQLQWRNVTQTRRGMNIWRKSGVHAKPTSFHSKIGIETSKMHAPLLHHDHFWVSQLEAPKISWFTLW
jgi:hypothetical protein